MSPAAGREAVAPADLMLGISVELRNQLLEKNAKRLVCPDIGMGGKPTRNVSVFFGIDADVVIFDRQEAAQHQSGADEQGERERYFGDDQAVAEALTFGST